MVLLEIVGMRDGVRPISITAPATEVPGLGKEFDGEIHLEGRIVKTGRRYVVSATVDAEGAFTCDDEQERGIGEDDRTLDITEDVRQVLTVAIPMQHIAPQFRDVPLEDLYPTLKDSRDSSELVDDPWAALQQLKRK